MTHGMFKKATFIHPLFITNTLPIEPIMRKILHASLLIACSFASSLAWAACTTSATGGGPIIYRLSGFNPPSFDPNISVGAVIHSQIVNLASVGGTIVCPSGIGIIIHHGTTGAAGIYNTYPTLVNGVGIRFKFSGGVIGPLKEWFPVSYNYGSLTNTFVNTAAILHVELVKTGTITAGGKIVGEVAAHSAEGGASRIVSYIVDGAIPIDPMVPTCKITPPPPVQLGNIPTSKFTGVGASTTAMPFKITLICSGGTQNAQTKIFVTLSDQTAPTNRTDVLSLASNSTARGIGIQVHSGSTLIKYGADSSATGNINQWFAGSSGNGVFDIPLTARYIQVAQEVTPGSANGRATFTMSYQ